MSDEIFYKGPSKEYLSVPGANKESKPEDVNVTKTGYADSDYLLKLLTLIRAEVRANIYIIEGDLNGLSMFVQADDTLLIEAIREEWPSSQGAVQYQIPYPFYQALELKDTASATYIRKRWEASARDVNGPSGFDIVRPLYVIKNEVEYIVDFMARFIGKVDDSSEERIVELFQEWAAVALSDVRQLKIMYQTETEGFTQNELDAIDAERATQYQALFKVKLNEANLSIDQNLAALKKTYSDQSGGFYQRSLGPALQFRLNAARQMTPDTSRIAKLAYDAAESTNVTLTSLVADLARRNNTFTQKLNGINDAIHVRDKYRVFVQQLSYIGKPATLGAIQANTFIVNPDSWFDAISESATPTTYRASHSKILDVEEVSSHPQYLDRYGRNVIEKDIAVKSGIKIDGVDLSTHAHTGQDGSQKIDGSSIQGLLAETVDRSITPSAPEGLRVLKKQVTSSGNGVDVEVAWDGPMNHVFDTQITPIYHEVLDTSFKIVYDGVSIPKSEFFSSIATFDGETFYCITLPYDMPPISNISDFIFYYKRLKSAEQETLISSTEIDPRLSFAYVVMLGSYAAYSADGDMYCLAFGDQEETGSILTSKQTKLSGTGELSNPILFAAPNPATEAYLYQAITFDTDQTKLYGSGLHLSDIPVIDETDAFNEVNFYNEHVSIVVDERDMVNGSVRRVTEIPLRTFNTTPQQSTLLPISDYGIDGFLYIGGLNDGHISGGAFVLKINPITGEFSKIPIPNIMTEIYAAFTAFGFLALQDEFLLSTIIDTEPDLPTYPHKYVYRMFSIKKDGTSYTDITDSIPIDSPQCLAKDRYGRVYSSRSKYNEIYRIFGPQGSGIYK